VPYFVYVIIGIITVLLIICIVVGFVFIYKNKRKIFAYSVYKKLYAYVKHKDYYLINNLVVDISENNNLHISHLLVSNKYVYVISSRYFDDDVVGESFSSKLWSIYNNQNKLIKRVDNPVIFNEQRTLMLADYLGCNQENLSTPITFISIVVTNDIEYNIKDKTMMRGSYILKKKDLMKLIKKIENESNLSEFNLEKLQYIINKLYSNSNRLKSKEAINKKV